MKNKNGKRNLIKKFILMSMVLSSIFFLSNFLYIKDKNSEKVIATENYLKNKDEKIKVYASGENVGIKISTKGVLAVAFSDIETEDNIFAKSPSDQGGIEIGDIITKIDGKTINTSKELKKAIDSSNNKITVTIFKNEKELNKIINVLTDKNKNKKIGLWVRDSTAGIGTLTFYEKNSGSYGALGHPITDSETEKILTVENGDILNSTVVNVRKGKVGSPGELKGLFVNERESLGNVEKNTNCGIFGHINHKALETDESKLYEIGTRSEIKLGPAQIITTIDEEGPKYYDVVIEKLLNQNTKSPKSMVIRVVDEELLNKTGGIVQGMSGSPIIQNGKIVGAVTHVLINKPDVGYGIYIEWMLKDANIIK
ncbi:MAG: SpoIVB peptidase [Sarcina sp.]